MFVVWNGAILGSIDSSASGGKVDPLDLLTQQSPSVGLLVQVPSVFPMRYSTL